MDKETRVLVTGGGGFVGSNYAAHLLDEGASVTLYDNFARGYGCSHNTSWLKKRASSNKLKIVKGDVKDYPRLLRAAKGCDLIVHAAAQVSVPLSVSNPRLDFDSNAVGTFNILEVARNLKTDPAVLYISSNKVYGIPDAELVELERRYNFKDLKEGVGEDFPLEGEEPYGVSKATGDSYLHAYYLRYGLRAVSFRCSCMYGPRQWGKEEQGWVAWFCIAAATRKNITIFGDGKQVRDLLYIDDVIRAFDSARAKIRNVAGEAFNLGGGRNNAVSLLQTLDFLKELSGRDIKLTYADWRPGDNKCYYTNINKVKKLLDWAPQISWKEGIKRTYEWVCENISLFN